MSISEPIPGRPSKGATFYRSFFDEQSRREISIKKLAAEKDIPYTTVMYWRNRFRKQDSDARSKTAAPKLVPVKLKASPRSPAPIQLHTSSGHTLHIPAGFCAETLGRLLQALSTPC